MSSSRNNRVSVGNQTSEDDSRPASSNPAAVPHRTTAVRFQFAAPPSFLANPQPAQSGSSSSSTIHEAAPARPPAFTFGFGFPEAHAGTHRHAYPHAGGASEPHPTGFPSRVPDRPNEHTADTENGDEDMRTHRAGPGMTFIFGNIPQGPPSGNPANQQPGENNASQTARIFFGGFSDSGDEDDEDESENGGAHPEDQQQQQQGGTETASGNRTVSFTLLLGSGGPSQAGAGTAAGAPGAAQGAGAPSGPDAPHIHGLRPGGLTSGVIEALLNTILAARPRPGNATDPAAGAAPPPAAGVPQTPLTQTSLFLVGFL
ncbi:hypothetical protein BDK51DRAFT_40389 [Blyttiomyces helicus]|uniref:Uncharacterized protein n=1 Tax=Blyttiomyces helicus TaxID=388810 RepID=A0A4P9W9V1_9FUNG|nr:hypothetical protein BDK51DRAFT_40389 [Blyttiomyces helicus]|eukprot:RKO88263.1 hypothetical protein BDK51DRAFT_40389 [Blyttiomyces helicus]